MTSWKLKVAAAAVLAVLGLLAVGRVAVYLVGKHEYKQPERAAAQLPDTTPREKGIADEKTAVENADKAKPYVEAEYRAFPVVGSRVVSDLTVRPIVVSLFTEAQNPTRQADLAADVPWARMV